jgi:transcriptional regulator with PAS, ATPase and Fis domain
LLQPQGLFSCLSWAQGLKLPKKKKQANEHIKARANLVSQNDSQKNEIGGGSTKSAKVLIRGELGTGKELVTKAIYKR